LLRLFFDGSILFRLGIAIDQFQIMMCCGDLPRNSLTILKVFIFLMIDRLHCIRSSIQDWFLNPSIKRALSMNSVYIPQIGDSVVRWLGGFVGSRHPDTVQGSAVASAAALPQLCLSWPVGRELLPFTLFTIA